MLFYALAAARARLCNTTNGVLTLRALLSSSVADKISCNQRINNLFYYNYAVTGVQFIPSSSALHYYTRDQMKWKLYLCKQQQTRLPYCRLRLQICLRLYNVQDEFPLLEAMVNSCCTVCALLLMISYLVIVVATVCVLY